MDIVVSPFAPPDRGPVEIVERKGVGHPDSLCDAVAELFARRLAQRYLDETGRVLHHNVDKALLCAGAAAPAFGGGAMLEPMSLTLAGRAVTEIAGRRLDIDGLAGAALAEWAEATAPDLDVARDVRLVTAVRHGSADLTSLFDRPEAERLSNDTSVGVGHAPPSPVEAVVLDLDAALRDPALRTAHPEAGPDIKIMAVRRGEALDLTVACAMIGRHITGMEDYVSRKRALAERLLRRARQRWSGPVTLTVNAADDPAAGRVYLTVTGLSAESGDDGQAGRGNRANGLICFHRPMSMEAVAGKNAVTHVGKIYNIAAFLLADAIVAAHPEARAAEVVLAGRIGAPIGAPMVADVRLARRAGELAEPVTALVRDQVPDLVSGLWRRLLAGEVVADRWPMSSSGAT